MKIKILFAFLIITQIGYSQKFLTKALAKVAKVVGKGNDQVTSSLTDMVPTVAIASNLEPAELGTIAQSFFSDWKSGGDQVFLMFTKKGSAGYWKIDGTVTVDGNPAEYVTSGMYSLISTASTSPRKIEITTTTGEKSAFTIEPYKKSIKLLSVNGQKDNVSLDLTKDVVIEVESAEAAENKLLKVSIAINQLNIKSIYDVCYTRIGSKITIPAAAFRNINITPGGNALYNYKNSYLSISVENIENAKDVSGQFPVVKYTSYYSDGKFITVTAEPNLNTGLTVKGTENLPDGKMDYTFFKPGAFISRPFEQMKKIGVISFAIRGTTYKQTSTQSETSTQIITKTTTLTFPKQPDAVWDAMLENIYPDIIGMVEAEFNATVLPLDAITKTEAYKTVDAFAKDDQNTTVEFARAYKNTKVLSAFLPVSEGYGVNGVNEKIMKEAGADALMTLTIDLQIEQDGEFVVMVPKLAFEIAGKTNGNVSNTKYCTGTIVGKGIRTTENITPQELEKIIRRYDLLTVFAKGLKEIKAKEKENGDYNTVWNLQK